MRNRVEAARSFGTCEQLIQLSLFPAAHPGVDVVSGCNDQEVASTDLVTDALRRGAPIAIGVSGGKDSSAVAFRTIEYLDAVGHHGPRLLIHSDLGRVEWRQSLPVCEQLSQRLGVELVVVRRQRGDLIDRLRQRWNDNVRRYAELSCAKLILPWPSPSMRFCTAELKITVICRELVRRFPR
jgi:3'-phosphoadenosine 5'-phosphosulfate sulfotransferase (PAPS reductase)/FAD synthetase